MTTTEINITKDIPVTNTESDIVTVYRAKHTVEKKYNYFDFDYKLDDFQKHSFDCIEKDENVLVTVPTGSGKSLIAMYAIGHTIVKKGKIAVYTAPIKSLSNEKYKDFSIKFGSEFTTKNSINVTVGILTGDNKINPDGNCLIMTAEILRNALYKLQISKETGVIGDIQDFSSKVDKIGCVVIDEIQFINDADRGKVWEETLVLLDPSVQIIMLSATLDGAEDFARWVANIKKKRTNLIEMGKRVVPLRHYIFQDSVLYNVLDENNTYISKNYQDALTKYKTSQIVRAKKHKSENNYNLIPEFVEFMKKANMLQCIFFSFSRANCEYYASLIKKNLVTFEERGEITKIFSSHMHKYEKQYETLPQYIKVKDLVTNGIAFHHSGLLPILKEIIEIIFSKKLIKVLFATETFAAGVNMPARTVVFTELEKYTQGGRRDIDTTEYRQMSGRAGRRGLDKVGYTVILPVSDFPSEQKLRRIMLGKMQRLESKLKIDYQFLLKAIQSKATSIEDFMNNSLFQKQQVSSARDIKDSISVINSRIDELEKEYIITLSKIPEKLEAVNTITKMYELTNATVATLNTNISVKVSVNKQQQKLHNSIKKQIEDSKELSYLYKIHCDLTGTKKELELVQREYNSIDKYLQCTYDSIIKYLRDLGYLLNNDKVLNTITFADVTMRGVLAAQINECNSLILTELLINDYFKDLNPEEIIAILSIFVLDAKIDEEISLDDIEATENIYDKLVKLNTLIDTLYNKEVSAGIVGNDEFWRVSYNYVDIAYMWACGCSVHEVMSYTGNQMYEGNFIKNMIKINNIAKDISCLCKICNKLELLPVFEKIDALIMRDIVTINSLYLS